MLTADMRRLMNVLDEVVLGDRTFSICGSILLSSAPGTLSPHTMNSALIDFEKKRS